MTSIRLTPAERQDLLDQYRRAAEPDVGHRAHALLLLNAGHPWATIGAVLFCSTSTISRWQRRFEQDGTRRLVGSTGCSLSACNGLIRESPTTADCPWLAFDQEHDE